MGVQARGALASLRLPSQNRGCHIPRLGAERDPSPPNAGAPVTGVRVARGVPAPRSALGPGSSSLRPRSDLSPSRPPLPPPGRGRGWCGRRLLLGRGAACAAGIWGKASPSLNFRFPGPAAQNPDGEAGQLAPPERRGLWTNGPREALLPVVTWNNGALLVLASEAAPGSEAFVGLDPGR
ncbi:hypothetical protein P7K49_012167 [Saguinus oedipus]|uniref:Uncharacterized protein n=1 Tax=Saguinus oedipus TaxID=9490 RepID=A0ABQ9VTB8_SAGOE|nr:hypothetical protein P7K49_012167 [Saguinus oedipus]